MRILFKNKDGILQCILATDVSFDKDTNKFYFYDQEESWEVALARWYAEDLIKKAWEEGKLDLTKHLVTECED